MIAFTESAGAKSHLPVYRLEVVLSHLEPRIWRRLQVPGNANFGWLHAVIQVAMGWTNSHLHKFRVGQKFYTDPAFQLDEFEGGPQVFDENKITLIEVGLCEGDALEYEYDFGDSWEHQITVKSILKSDPEADKIALCVDGACACPPEDCVASGAMPNCSGSSRIRSTRSTNPWWNGSVARLPRTPSTLPKPTLTCES